MGRRGAAGKPVSHLKLTGEYRESKHGHRANAPVAEGVPERPAELAGEAAALWDEVTAQLVKIGAAGAIDRSALRTACEAWGLYRAAYAEVATDPLDATNARRYGLYFHAWLAAAAKVGLTPADRQRLHAQFAPEPKGVSSFARGRKGVS